MGAPATCDHTVTRPLTRSWIWARLSDGIGLARLVTMQTPLAASRRRHQPGGIVGRRRPDREADVDDPRAASLSPPRCHRRSA